MGLRITHHAWQGAYSAFSRWRNKLAEIAGYAFYEAGNPPMTFKTALIDWGHITEANLFGKWDRTPEDPLIVLIAHSDCEGSIYPEQAGPLADRLEKLLPLLEGDGGGHIGDYREKTEQFIVGLRQAAKYGEPVEFL